MPLVSSSISNLVNGVSQQPYTLRLSSQAEIQENGLSTVSQGLKKRPPTTHVKKIYNAPVDGAYVHTINRDDVERYQVVIVDDDLKVFDLDGNEKTVNFPEGKAYLNVTDAQAQFRAVTVADYTFLVNTTIPVQLASVNTPFRPNEALLVVKSGLYGKTYDVTINGTVRATFTTPDGSVAAHVSQISTDYIADQLTTQLLAGTTATTVTPTSVSYVVSMPELLTVTFNLASGNNASNTIVKVDGNPVGFTLVSGTTFKATYRRTGSLVGYTPVVTAQNLSHSSGTALSVIRYGSSIHVVSPSSFSIVARDGYNNAAMLAAKDTLQRFSDLPANGGANGFAVQIVGDKDTQFDNYYVRYETGVATGVWKESSAPNIGAGLLNSSMPWALIRESNGTFTFKSIAWDQRLIGDDKSAPHPSFVGRKITDAFFYRNRLSFLADESAVFSEAGEFFNFYPTTVTALLDGDPIDVTVSHSKVSNLNAAIPFSKQLILFSSQTQFSLDAGDLLTGKTVSIKPTTEYECSSEVRPLAVGRNIYFVVPKGDNSGVREYSVDRDTNSDDAVDVTSHVPQYLPKGIFKLAAALNEDVMVGLSDEEPNILYVYKFYWNNNEKLQSSWSRWVFPTSDQILNVDFIQSRMILVINRADGVYLESLNISTDIELDGEPYLVHLDRKKLIPKSALNYVGGYTVIDPAAVGWDLDDGSYIAVTPTGQPKRAGILADVVWDGTNAKILGNLSDCDLIVGRKYSFRYRFSTIVPKARTTNGERADTVARLQLRKLQVNYADTGYFKAEVTPYGRPTYTYIFSGKILGLPSATIGEVTLETGSFGFPIMSRNTTVDIELVSDSPLPCSFLSADWEGMYAKRSKGI